MKVFVAGATGAIGRRVIPVLIRSGHEVVGMTRSAASAEALRAQGAEPIIANALDRDAVVSALSRVEPDAVIHQLTGLTGVKDYRRFDREFAATNRLRIVGTDNLLEGAREAGVRRFIAQSYTGWTYGPAGSDLRTESDPLHPDPLPDQRESLAAIRHLESQIMAGGAVEGIALRYGSFYGPGTAMGEGGDIVGLVRKRRLPIIGSGAGVWSFIHIDDAASATVAALEQGAPGIYNVVDDDPAPVREWLPAFAKAAGAPPPLRVPAWLGRLAAGEVAVFMMTRIGGVSNAKARRELGWEPRYSSWREGFPSAFDDGPAASGGRAGPLGVSQST